MLDANHGRDALNPPLLGKPRIFVGIDFHEEDFGRPLVCGLISDWTQSAAVRSPVGCEQGYDALLIVLSGLQKAGPIGGTNLSQNISSSCYCLYYNHFWSG